MNQLQQVLSLQKQVQDLENRNVEREAHLNHLLEAAKRASSEEVAHLKVYYSEALRRKNREIEHFKNELDSLLAALGTLQEQQQQTSGVAGKRANLNKHVLC